MADRHEVEIETVAEVMAVDRETLTILFHDDERLVHLMSSPRWRDLQSITFPLAATRKVIAALQAIVDAEGEA